MPWESSTAGDGITATLLQSWGYRRHLFRPVLSGRRPFYVVQKPRHPPYPPTHGYRPYPCYLSKGYEFDPSPFPGLGGILNPIRAGTPAATDPLSHIARDWRPCRARSIPPILPLRRHPT